MIDAGNDRLDRYIYFHKFTSHHSLPIRVKTFVVVVVVDVIMIGIGRAQLYATTDSSQKKNIA